ncbi:hypothetical protein Y1Q_0006100 [Alligator mississippiensis]|uniref:Uncharacterized protein n=1 Tax=Alligator mississippiensis TaxID=8496 RepID=A0A151N412_ALLMI|nr:hypothetical protein Y1Q_0006100 [Alligator mississippiensis]
MRKWGPLPIVANTGEHLYLELGLLLKGMPRPTNAANHRARRWRQDVESNASTKVIVLETSFMLAGAWSEPRGEGTNIGTCSPAKGFPSALSVYQHCPLIADGETDAE